MATEITDLWRQALSLRIVSEDPAVRAWMAEALAQSGAPWRILDDTAGDGGAWDVLVLDGALSVNAVLTLLDAREGQAEPSTPALLIVPDETRARVAGRIAADDAIVHPGTDPRELDSLLRYSIGRRSRAIISTDHVNFDPETGFSRPGMFETIARLALRRAARLAGIVAVLAIVNDWVDAEGEPVVIDPRFSDVAFGRRLNAVRRRSDFVSAEAPGEILMVLEALRDTTEIDVATRRIVDRLLEPFEGPDGAPVFARIAIGISHSTGGVDDPGSLVREALAAANRSRRELAG